MPLSTYTPFPLSISDIGVDNEPITITLETDADVLLGASGPEKDAERDRVRQQIRDEFGAYSSQRAGIVLTFGISPRPLEGNRLAAEVNRLLLEEFPDVFDGAVLKEYHIINPSTSQRGTVEVEVYLFVATP